MMVKTAQELNKTLSQNLLDVFLNTFRIFFRAREVARNNLPYRLAGQAAWYWSILKNYSPIHWKRAACEEILVLSVGLRSVI